MDLRKYNDDGSRWFGPCPPIEGLTPILEPLTKDQAKADFEETVRIRNRVEKGRRVDIDKELWYTADDPEWLADVFIEHDIVPDPGPILRPVIERIREEKQMTRAQAAAELVAMDKPSELADQIVGWALASGLQAAKQYRRCEPPDQDIISIGFHLLEFVTSGLGWAMDVVAAEKEWHENDMDDRGFVYGWRPAKVVEHLTGLENAVVAAADTPAMGPRPQGHSLFFEYMCYRAGMFLNGPGVDKILSTTGIHGGVYRVFAFVHSMREAHEGASIARRAARGLLDDYRP